MWKDILKQKPLSMSVLETGAAVEYGGKEMGDWKNKIESLIPKMPADIKAGYDKAMVWVQSQMDPPAQGKTTSLIDRAKQANKENPRMGSAEYKR